MTTYQALPLPMPQVDDVEAIRHEKSIYEVLLIVGQENKVNIFIFSSKT